MSEIEVIIKPNYYGLRKHAKRNKFNVFSVTDTELLLNATNQFLLEIVEVVCKAITSKGTMESIMDTIIDSVMEKAYANASSGYSNLPYNTRSVSWQQRSNITKILYEASQTYSSFYIHEETDGLDSGAGALLSSLKSNIINERKVSRIGSEVSFGTEFFAARLLEEGTSGGLKRDPAEYPSMGLSKDGELAGWLMDAMEDPYFQGKFDKEGIKTAAELQSFLNTEHQMSSRPFLKPALWYVEDKGEHVEISIKFVSFAIRYSADVKIRII